MTNILRPSFGGKSQVGDSKKKTSEIKNKSHSQRAEFKDIKANGDVNFTVNQTIIDAGKKNPKIPKLPPMDNRITAGHKAELHHLVDELVALQHIIEPSKTQPSLYQWAWIRAKSQAKSEGDCGVRHIDFFPDCDFEIAKHYLQLRIRILKNNKSVWKDNKSWRTDRLNAIHARCDELGISNDKRQAYQLARFGLRLAKTQAIIVLL